MLPLEHDDISSFNHTIYNDTYLNASLLAVVPVTLTSVELWIQLLFFYIFFCGILINCIGTAIWVGIFRNNDLRTRFYIIMGFLTFCRTCYCTNYLVAGIFRCLRTADIVAVSQRRIVCHCLNFWFINGDVLEQALLLALVIDRMIALMALDYYRLLTDRSAVYLCAGLYASISVITLGPSYVLIENLLDYAPCIDSQNYLKKSFTLYKQNLTLTMVFAILFLYCVLIVYLRMRTKALEVIAAKSVVAKASLERQLKIMPLFRNTVFLHCLFTLTARLSYFLAGYFPAEYSQRFVALGGIVQTFDLFVNMIVLLVLNADIRKAALPCWRSNSVAAMSNQTA